MTPGYVIKELEKKAEYLSGFISSGNCVDYTEYKFIAGQLRGLVFCKELIEDAVRKALQEEESQS